MGDFRSSTPERRDNFPVGRKYSGYKPLLREDFHQRCGYCGDHDFFRMSYYEIDHLVPRTLAPEMEDDYSNLVYSCRGCNNSKRSKWPTQDKLVHNNGKEGWIDPCDLEYAEQFERLIDGSIKPKTILGDWMWKELSLGNPKHRVIWMLEQLRVELSKTDTIHPIDVQELTLIKELNERYRRFEEKLRGTPNFE